MKSKDLLIYLTVTGLILIVAFTFSLKPINLPFVNPLPTPTPYPVDTVNDGVYTNYEYGFRFEYPTEVFEYQPNSMTLSTTPEGYPGVLQEEDLVLWVIIQNESEASSIEDRFKSLYEMQTGVTTTKGITVLESRDKGSYKYVISSLVTPEDRATEASYSYSLRALKENILIEIIFFTSSPEHLENNKGLFIQIADSFVFND